MTAQPRRAEVCEEPIDELVALPERVAGEPAVHVGVNDGDKGDRLPRPGAEHLHEPARVFWQERSPVEASDR